MMGRWELQFVRTEAMAADQLTKHVGLQVLVAGKSLRECLLNDLNEKSSVTNQLFAKSDSKK